MVVLILKDNQFMRNYYGYEGNLDKGNLAVPQLISGGSVCCRCEGMISTSAASAHSRWISRYHAKVLKER